MLRKGCGPLLGHPFHDDRAFVKLLWGDSETSFSTREGGILIEISHSFVFFVFFFPLTITLFRRRRFHVVCSSLYSIESLLSRVLLYLVPFVYIQVYQILNRLPSNIQNMS